MRAESFIPQGADASPHQGKMCPNGHREQRAGGKVRDETGAADGTQALQDEPRDSTMAM
jgi:hypothetical protein